MSPALAAPALPTGGSVASGSASIGAPSNGTLTINQASNKAIVNWNSFSIGNGGTVNFNNGSGATLNRVTGTSTSAIDGNLNATGSVYLINPSGVIVGKTGIVKVGGNFVASTLDASDAQFNAGGSLTLSGNGTAATVNYGKIGSLGGDVALVAKTATNAGTVTAPNGTVGVLAGSQVTLRDSALNDGKFSVDVGSATDAATNTGTIQAADAELKANGGNVYALAGNTKGMISATGTSSAGGKVFLSAGGGTTEVAGGVSAKNADGSGGEIVATGHTITIDASANIAASGTTGGVVLIGGDQGGGADPAKKHVAGPVQTATTTNVASGAQISADGTAGAGGAVVVWSDDTTSYLGVIDARGTNTGNGGFAEVSSHGVLDFEGTVDLTADNGATGTLLLDPFNVSIKTSGTPSVTGSGNPATFTPTANTSVVTVTNLQNALKNSNVVINTGTAGSQAGTITVSNAVGASSGWTAATTLTLQAASTITISAAITGTNGGLVLNAGGNISIGGAINVGTLTINSPTAVTQTAAITASNLALTGAGSYTLTKSTNNIGTLAANSGAIALVDSAALTVGTVGATTGITSTGAVSLTDTGNMTTNAGLSAGGALTIADTGSLTANGTLSASGALSIGSTANIAFNANVSTTSSAASLIKADSNGTGTGAVTLGSGVTFSSPGAITLYYDPANNPAGSSVNATSYTNQPTFTNVGGGTITPYMLVNSLADLQDMQNNPSGSYVLTTNIDASATSGWNSGAGFVPVGSAATPFTGSFNGQGHMIANLTIDLTATADVGLFGAANGATIANVGLVGGGVTGGADTGALIGLASNTTISSDYASTPVIGATHVGGLVGELDGFSSITASFATGTVEGTRVVGGLVGITQANISQSFATGTVIAILNTAGGLVGELTGGASSQVYATGAVTAPSNTGGLVGTALGGSLSSAYWDTNTTGLPNAAGTGSVGGTPLTSAQFATASNFVGWTFGTTAGTTGWVIVDTDATLNNAGGATGGTRPIPLALASTNGVITNGYQLQLVALNLAGSYTLGADIDLSSLNLSSTGGLWFGNGFVPLGSAVYDEVNMPLDQGETFTNVFVSSNPFTGTFNGQNHTISNLYINRPNQQFVGLFGYTAGSTIENVALGTGTVIGGDFTGGLAGEIDWLYLPSQGQYQPANVMSVSSGVNVTGGNQVGGVAGYLHEVPLDNFLGTVSSASGNVSGQNYVGGFVGYGQDDSFAPFNNVSATGNVSGDNYVGGFAGYLIAGGLETDSGRADFATGNVTGNTDVGGFIGWSVSSWSGYTIYATGNVNGVANVGGFVGLNDYGASITDSFATGNVTGTTNVGGFVGQNNQAAIIDTSFATGTVNGQTNVGGFAGDNLLQLNDIYATGSVYGVTNVGGLVGNNDSQYYPAGTNFSAYVESGAISNGLALGYVSGTTNVGGLVGNNAADANTSVSGSKAASISNSYFDTSTTGQSVAVGQLNGTTATATAKTSAQLQSMAIGGTGYVGWSTSNWGIVSGSSFPYFKWLYTSTPQVVTGTAYTNVGTTVNPGATAGLFISGLTGTAGSATAAAAAKGSAGANGIFYVLLPNGTLSASAGKTLIAYTTGNYAGATVKTNVTAVPTGLFVYGNALYAATGANTLSGAIAGVDALASTSATTVAAINAVTGFDLAVANTSFTIDKTLNTTTAIAVMQPANAAITVADPITLTGAGTLTLSATGELAIDAPISVTGAGAVSLQASAVSQISTTGVVLGAGDSINYGSTNNGGTLSIDGASYSLLYAMSAIQNVSASLDGSGNVIGNYALATNIDASGTTYTGSLIAGTPINTQADGQFNGLFEGLGNTISNLTINNTSTGSDLPLGLISMLGATGAVSDVRLTNESVTSDWANVGGLVGDDVGGVIQGSTVNATVTGTGRTGTIVGFIDVGGVLQSSSASGSAKATTSNGQAGGAVGAMKGAAYNDTTSANASASFYAGGFVGVALSGTLTNDSASGTVLGTTAGTSTPTYIGGFAGYNAGVMTGDSASGSVGNSSASLRTGGFVGVNAGTITSSHATGTIVMGGTQTGGFAGLNNAGTITGSSASDTVTGTTLTGGFIGENMAGSTVSNDSATGAVSGTTYVGGFVGQNDATTIASATASGTVSGSVNGAGGFAGYNMTGGTLSNDSASGAVTGAAIALAGFAGINYGTVTGDTETGAVGNASATGNIGGLVGHNFGTVSLSSAKGNVQGQNNTGGLVGINSGTVQQSFATGTVTGKTKTGGLIGENDATVKNVYATGATSGTQYVGGLIGWNQGPVSYAYSTGTASGTQNVAGALGADISATGPLLDVYWDVLTSGLTRGIGAGTLTGATAIDIAGNPDPTQAATYAGFDFTNVWVVTTGNKPVLIGVN